jgi:hypothetical protein
METLAILILLLLAFPLMVQAGSYPITWHANKIEPRLGVGATQALTITFTTSTAVKNVDVWITPELKPFRQLTLRILTRSRPGTVAP